MIMSLFTKDIYADKIFYHIYPLGLSGAPEMNDFNQPAGNCFEILTQDLDRIKSLGCNALYIGPVFESTKHGYDTVDYYHIDRRLGNNEKFKNFCDAAHEKGFSVVLDAVFNHTGRNFFAFRDLIQNGRNSIYKDWYLNLNFDSRSFYGDCFSYDGWAGCMDLVKLNLSNTDVQSHIFGAVKFWMETFKIDGLRLDAADVIDKQFLDNLGNFCRSLKNDFWLMGEVVHGDYNQWAKEGRIDSVTNYQIYNSLWASINSQNFFDVSYNLNREFGSQNGLYRYAPLYNFLDNHDVNRLCSVLTNPKSQIKMVYALMFAIPGIPSIYYGSEYGIKGIRNNQGDIQLRPSLPPFNQIPDYAKPDFDASFLEESIRRFAKIRQESIALQKGNYEQVFVSNKQFAFTRTFDDRKGHYEKVLIVCNCENSPQTVNLPLNLNPNQKCRNLDSNEEFNAVQLKNFTVPAFDVKFIRVYR